MATFGATNLTYVDWAGKPGNDGTNAGLIVELLSQTNEMMQDAVVIEGNLPTGHKTVVRTGIPQGTWRLLYQGAQPTKSTTAVVTDTIGILETYSVIDKDLADLDGNSAELRMQEDTAFLEGLNQQMQATVIYGNIATNPERFQGLAPRYNTLNSATAATAVNVISGGGSGSANTSVWLIVWGNQTCAMIFPKGSKVGLTHEDVTTSAPISDGAGGFYQAYQTKYQWKAGLTVRDWRYVVRICNIDTTSTSPGLQSATPVNLQRLMIRAINKIPNIRMGKPCFYMNRAVKTWADIQAVERSTMAFQAIDDSQGLPLVKFRGIPCRLVDQILNTEATVS